MNNIQRISSIVIFLMLLTFSTNVLMPKVSYERPHIHLIEYISNKYHKDPKLIKLIVFEAEKNSNKERFPTLHDTLAIISIESSFNSTAVSTSGALGLMQILYTKTSFEPTENISHGTILLKEYRDRLATESDAVQAYNLGIGNFKEGIRNQKYLHKFKQAKEEIVNADSF